VRLLTWAERPDLAERGPPSNAVWPEYNLHGDVFDEHWEALLERFPEYQFALLNDADEVVAEGHTGPIVWNGSDEALPGGIDEALQGVTEAGDTLCALAAEVSPTAQQRGLARELLAGMRLVAAAHGLERLVAPVRPSWKDRYPITPIEQYVQWRRADGALLDPWMRLHERLGARIGPSLPRSMQITGSVSEWESWTGLVFPEPGSYVFPQGLAPLEIAGDRGFYWEPNVWMIHPDIG